MIEIHLGEIDDLAIAGLEHAGIGETQLLHRIGDPALAETLPSHHVDRAFAEQRPHGHFDRPGVGRRHDADAVVRRHLQDVAGEVDGLLELGLARLGAMGAPEHGALQGIEGPAGALCAGAG